jgi:ribosomal-protein-alanine N-acetyltransferase
METLPGTAPSEWRIDRMREEDLPEVMAIEQASFLTPWPRGAFLEEIRSNPYARCVVVRERAARGPAALAAYICYWILGEELLINNLAAAVARRRHGHARALVEHAFEEARASECRLAFLDVRPSNAAAIRLYSGFGFQVVGRRKQYYADSKEDALVMRATLQALETP